MPARTRDFEKLLLGSIDEALLSLGESARQSIYFHVENDFELNRKEIPKHLDKFHLALEKIFGAGAKFIEILIMKSLHRRVNKPLHIENGEQMDFIKYVDAVKCSFLQNAAAVPA